MNQPSLSLHEPLLVNLAGHSAGAIIFGTFLYLFLRNRKTESLQGSWWAVVAAASLAVLWNVGSLGVLAGVSLGWRGTEWLAGLTFCTLSSLPAVLLRLSLDNELRWFVRVGYALSSAAVVIQCEALLLARPDDRGVALLLITGGFGTLTAVSAGYLIFRRGASGRLSRIVGSMCLFLLAMSFVHLGSGQPLLAWSRELALHHCGIPLALFVLLQDYRFVLIDAFLRFLVNYLLAALVAWGAIEGAMALHIIPLLPVSSEVIFVLAVCFALVGFAVFRNLVQRWLTRVVFRRPGIEGLRQMFQESAGQTRNEGEFLLNASAALAGFLKAERHSVIRGDEELPRWEEAAVPMQFAQGDACTIVLGRRQGGRQYLSEDHEALRLAGAMLAEEVARLREAEVQRLVSGAELRALQSQINPHFLFNSLNALYGIIPRESAAARRTVLNLATLFRYLLQSPQTMVSVADEMQIVEAYLEIEKLRLGTRLRLEMEVAPETLGYRIPSLSIQPLMENAVKHGLAATSEPGVIWLRTNVARDQLRITVENTCPAEQSEGGSGIGLANVRRRLELCFGEQSSLSFEIANGLAKAEFTVPASAMAAQIA